MIPTFLRQTHRVDIMRPHHWGFIKRIESVLRTFFFCLLHGILIFHVCSVKWLTWPVNIIIRHMGSCVLGESLKELYTYMSSNKIEQKCPPGCYYGSYIVKYLPKWPFSGQIIIKGPSVVPFQMEKCTTVSCSLLCVLEHWSNTTWPGTVKHRNIV